MHPLPRRNGTVDGTMLRPQPAQQASPRSSCGFSRPCRKGPGRERYSGTTAGAPNSTPFRSRPSATTIAAKAKTVTPVSAMLVA